MSRLRHASPAIASARRRRISGRARLVPGVALLGGFLCLAGLRAEDYTWTGNSSNWLNGSPENWNPSGSPTNNGDSILFDGSGVPYPFYRVGGAVGAGLGGSTGLMSMTVTSGQTEDLNLFAQIPAGSAPIRFDVMGSLSIAPGAGPVTFGGEKSGSLAIGLGGGNGELSGVTRFVNDSSNAATIAPGVSIGKGGLAKGTRQLEFSGAGDWNVAATIKGSADADGGRVSSGLDGLIKSGAGTLFLSSTVDELSLDTVEVREGALELDGELRNPDASVTVEAAGTLAGSGTVAGSAMVRGTLSGRLTFSGNLALGANGQFNWKMRDAASDFDTLTIAPSGTLDLSALTAAKPFLINLWSLAKPGGAAPGFDPAKNRAWPLVKTGGAISGFGADKFRVNTAAVNGTGGFPHPVRGVFAVALSADGRDLLLTYTANPSR